MELGVVAREDAVVAWLNSWSRFVHEKSKSRLEFGLLASSCSNLCLSSSAKTQARSMLSSTRITTRRQLNPALRSMRAWHVPN